MMRLYIIRLKNGCLWALLALNYLIDKLFLTCFSQ